jgi:cobalt-zinc-cadmium efflux system outer membrane protein
MPTEPLELPALWRLAQTNNPTLRESAAELEATGGRLIQAGKYPNPHFRYEEDELGETRGPAGTIKLQVNQEIVTAGKRRLDLAIAAQGRDAASVALLGRKFDVLTRVRRAYYDYLGMRFTVQSDREVVAALGQAMEITRKLVEEAKTRPPTDLIRIEALLEEAKTDLARNQVNAEAAWQQLASEVGVPQSPMPQTDDNLPDNVPDWDATTIRERVLTANTELKQAALEAERARLAIERAKAEAVPNVTVGGGYTRNFPEFEAGAVITLETPLPLWDRKQGLIQEAEARWAQARAAEQSTATRLTRETAAAFARYQTARLQAERLTTEVLPRLRKNLELLHKGYQAGASQVAFSDVLLAEVALNTARLSLAEARRKLWLAIADLQGLMQLDLGEDAEVPASRHN